MTLWAATSTVSGGGDQGADPNELVSITDQLAATAPPVERFSVVMPPTNMKVVRGVSFTPGAPAANVPELPWLALVPLSALTVGGVAVWRRRTLPSCSKRSRSRSTLPKETYVRDGEYGASRGPVGRPADVLPASSGRSDTQVAGRPEAVPPGTR